MFFQLLTRNRPKEEHYYQKSKYIQNSIKNVDKEITTKKSIYQLDLCQKSSLQSFLEYRKLN